MQHYESTQAIVIKTNTIKESDLVVTLLTPHKGKITVFAKGVKNIKSNRLGSLQLGNVIKAYLYKKNESYWLTESITTTPFMKNQKNLTQYNLLFYYLEILNKLIADNQQLDSIYYISLNIIQSINRNHLVSFIASEIEFLNQLGFGTPQEIISTFNKHHYISCQKLIKEHLESIIEKPLQSSQLFN